MADEQTRKPSIPRGADEHPSRVSPQPSKTDAAGRHVRPDDSPTPPTMREVRGERVEKQHRPTAETSTEPKAEYDDRVEGDEQRENEGDKP